ncbi:MAG: 30S ribosome-binding factor RbfA [Oligoflexia bacterium]|nr:30S ribosome-binding factor RbfA [Oligoflexia bacterium]
MGSDKSYKKVRLEEKILQELNVILRQDLNDSRLQFVSFTKIKLSQDNSYAEVSWDTFDSGKRGDCKKALEASIGKIRSLLSSKLQMRHTPELRLSYDGQFEGEQNITKILEDESKSGKGF